MSENLVGQVTGRHKRHEFMVLLNDMTLLSVRFVLSVLKSPALAKKGLSQDQCLSAFHENITPTLQIN